NNSELKTTVIELSAIARPANSGDSVNPSAENIPAATGISITLYMKAQNKLIKIRLYVFRANTKEVTTSIKSFLTSTIPPDSIAISLPDPIAIPTVAVDGSVAKFSKKSILV
ncbi:hypothetical protein IHP97_13170, partial [Enterococcus faecalis]|nr:hypothetical protein [Enterococcus faecalis]